MVFVFIALILLCLVCQAYFTMMEMAIVSIDRIRLEYRAQNADTRALIIKSLLDRPSFLFTTTLIGVNTFLQIGSECSRLLFTTISINPNYSAFSQIFITLLFAELIPLMIARQYSDTIALRGAKILNSVKLALTPILWFMQKINLVIEYLLGNNKSSLFSLSRKELESVMAQKGKKNSFDLVTLMQNLNELKLRRVQEIMIPLKKLPLFSYKTDISHLKDSLKKNYHPFVLIYMKQKSAILGIVFARNLLDKTVSSITQIIQPAWFVSDSTPIKMLKLFRQNKQKMAVVLNKKGDARGVITLNTILSEILMNTHKDPLVLDKVVDKHFCLDTKISFLNQQYNLHLPDSKGDKLSHLFHTLHENPIHVGHVRLTKKDRRVHVETLHS